MLFDFGIKRCVQNKTESFCFCNQAQNYKTTSAKMRGTRGLRLLAAEAVCWDASGKWPKLSKLAG